MRIKKRVLSIYIFIILSVSVDAQTILTGFITDTLGKPVTAASVYLSKTTYGAMTDIKGEYSFAVQQDGVYDLIVSCVGYKPFTRIIQTDGRKQLINLTLSVNLIQLDEIVVSSKDKKRLKNLSIFTRILIGETANSKSCRIVNPEDIHLYDDTKSMTLKAFSIRPVKLINRSLGYTLSYDLTNFTYNYETGLVSYTGNPYFQQMNGTAANSKTWHRNRLSVYFGSRTHFLRTFFSDSLRGENFKIFSYQTDTTTGDKSIIRELSVNDIRTSENKYYLKLFSKDPVLISYTDTHEELSTSILGFQQKEYLSTIYFSDTITVFPNGNFYNPYSITWGGEMADERIADMLPFEFAPGLTEGKKDPNLAETSGNLSVIDKFLAVQQSYLSPDQVFVHLDRNLYRPGDTIYFQAYLRNRFTEVFESASISLYALLFDENRMLVDSSRFKIERFLAPGWMMVPLDAKSGNYHFVAFTGQMQNYDPVYAFQCDLFINAKEEYAEKIEVSYNKKDFEPGDTLEAVVRISDINSVGVSQRKFQCSLISENKIIDRYETRTNQEGESAIRFIIPDTVTIKPELTIITQNSNKASVKKNFQIPFFSKYLDLRFLPEGGTFVEGLEQRVGFNATDIKGRSVRIEGLLKSSTGKIIDTIRSGKYGPGLFVCAPLPGMFVELLNAKSEKRIWPLPAPDKSGISLSVRPVTGKSFGVEIQSGNYNGDTVIVSGTMNSIKVFSSELVLTKKLGFVIDSDVLPQGVIQITLFTKKLTPLAERLFYVNAGKHIKFDIKTDRVSYNEGQETELSISAADDSGNPVKGIFSISVADSASGYNSAIFTPGIGYVLDYHPYFLRNLPPEVLLKGLENLSGAERDLILMVYGWKKYNWNFNYLQPESSPGIINYELLNMKVLSALRIRKADRRIDLVSLEGPSIFHFITDEDGKVSVRLDSLPDITRSVTMMPDPKNKKRATQAMLSIPYNQKFFKSEKLHIQAPQLPDYSLNTANKRLPVPLNEKTIELSEITVTAARQNKILYHDEYEEKYKYADVRSLEPGMLWTASSLKDAIYRLIVPYIFTDNYIILEQSRSMFGGAVPALFVLDGMPLYYNGWSQVSTISPEEITSLTILKGKQGFTQYGEAAQGGVIFVNTRTKNPELLKFRVDWKLQHKKDKLLLPIDIYRRNVEFYSPSKSEIDTYPAYQRRSTIYWNSEIYMNGDSAATIKFINHKRAGPVIITINGVSSDGHVGSGYSSYIVRDK